MEGFHGEFLPVLQQYFLEADTDGDGKLGPEELAVLAQMLDDDPENPEARQEGEQELEDGSARISMLAAESSLKQAKFEGDGDLEGAPAPPQKGDGEFGASATSAGR